MAVLAGSNVTSRIPAQDLRRARSFYAEKLGLEPVEERPGGFVTGAVMASSRSSKSAAAAARDHTQMAWEVDDLEETIAQLRERGVIFEEYDVPGLETVTGLPRSKELSQQGRRWREGRLVQRQRGQPTCHRSSRDLKYSGPATSREHSAERLRRRKRRP
jgi:catechol 2,3-dioxygenase-like lactoylglutathione lyase family enzyme